jgi:TonB family protein
VSSLLATAPSSQVLAQTANAAVASAAEQTPSDLESRRQVELSAAPAARVDTQALDQQAVQNSAQNVKQALSHAAQGAAVSGGGRSDKDIAGVFAQHQPSLHKVYERARRQTPGLAGKLVLEFAIAADGSVSSLRVVASELNNSELEASIISRVKQFRFAAGKPQTGVRYAMEFLP